MPDVQTSSPQTATVPPQAPPSLSIDDIGANALNGPVSMSSIVSSLRSKNQSELSGLSDSDVLRGFFGGAYRASPHWTNAMQHEDDINFVNDLGGAAKTSGPSPSQSAESDFSKAFPGARATQEPPSWSGMLKNASIPGVNLEHVPAATSLYHGGPRLNAVAIPQSAPMPGTPNERMASAISGGLGAHLPDLPPQQPGMGVMEGIGRGAYSAAQQVTPGVVSTALLAGATGKVLPFLGKSIAKVFTGDMLLEAANKIPGVYDSIKSGDYGNAAKLITQGSISGALSVKGMSELYPSVGRLVGRIPLIGRFLGTPPPSGARPEATTAPSEATSPAEAAAVTEAPVTAPKKTTKAKKATAPPAEAPAAEAAPVTAGPTVPANVAQAAVAQAKTGRPMVPLPDSLHGQQKISVSGIGDVRLNYEHPADEAVSAMKLGTPEQAKAGSEYMRSNYSTLSPKEDVSNHASAIRKWISEQLQADPALVKEDANGNKVFDVPAIRTTPPAVGKGNGKTVDSIAKWSSKLANDSRTPAPASETSPAPAGPNPVTAPLDTKTAAAAKSAGKRAAKPVVTKPPAPKSAVTQPPTPAPSPTPEAAPAAPAPVVAKLITETPDGWPKPGQALRDIKGNKYTYGGYNQYQSGKSHVIVGPDGNALTLYDADLRKKFPTDPSVRQATTIQPPSEAPVASPPVPVADVVKQVVSDAKAKEAEKTSVIKKKEVSSEPPAPAPVEDGPKEGWQYKKSVKYGAGVFHTLRDPVSGKLHQVEDSELQRDYPVQAAVAKKLSEEGKK